MIKLQGKKTYIVALIIILQAFLSWYSGDASLADAVNQVLVGTGLATLRAGVLSASIAGNTPNQKTDVEIKQ